MIGASSKSDPSIREVAGLSELSKIEDNEGIRSQPTGNARPKGWVGWMSVRSRWTIYETLNPSKKSDRQRATLGDVGDKSLRVDQSREMGLRSDVGRFFRN
jgi:hypothetical protein